jgi:hypothetical protein
MGRGKYKVRCTVSDLTYLKGRLVDMAEAAARDLLPQGKRQGQEWYASGSRSPLGFAVSVVVAGPKRGIVGLWGEERGTDLLGLSKAVHGDSFPAALQWAYSFTGIKPDDAPERPAPKVQHVRPTRADDRKKARRARGALDIWREGKPIAGTLAESYLIGRGLARSEWPASLRFHPQVEWQQGATFENDKWVAPGPLYPALIAGVQGPDRKVCAIWRIYLDETGGKAQFEPNKVGMGSMTGGAVRLGPPTRVLGVAEGLETALAVRQLVAGEYSIWSGLSTSGIMSMFIPLDVQEVVIYCDNDIPKRNPKTGEWGRSPGIYAAEKLRDRLIGEGRAARLNPAPLGRDFLDAV